MDDLTRALTIIKPIAGLLTEWTLGAMDSWLDEHPLPGRADLSSLTRHNYLYDKVIAVAERTVTPISIRVHGHGRMRWISVTQDDLTVAVWVKNIDIVTHLTCNYPTLTAKQRQRSWRLFDEHRTVLLVCGHTIMEDIAGADAWIDRILLTQETRDANGRRVTLRRPLYFNRVGSIPLMVTDPQQRLPGMEELDVPYIEPPAQIQLPRVRVKPRVPTVAAAPETPTVGVEKARREADAERLRQQAEANRKNKTEGA